MSDCPACERAATNIRSGIYQSGCQSCEARAIAQGPAAHQRDADPSVLQAEMRRVWPDHEEYRKGRALVWEYIKRLEEAKERQC